MAIRSFSDGNNFVLTPEDFPKFELVLGEQQNGDPSIFIQGQPDLIKALPASYVGTSEDPYLTQWFIISLKHGFFRSVTDPEFPISAATHQSDYWKTCIRCLHVDPQVTPKSVDSAFAFHKNGRDGVYWFHSLAMILKAMDFSTRKTEHEFIEAQMSENTNGELDLAPIPEISSYLELVEDFTELELHGYGDYNYKACLRQEVQELLKFYSHREISEFLHELNSSREELNRLHNRSGYARVFHVPALTLARIILDEGSFDKALETCSSLPGHILNGLYCPNIEYSESTWAPF